MTLHSDQGRDFTSELFPSCCELLGIGKTPTTPWHPQSDELVERMPGSFLCSRSTFSADPRVKAFFVNPRHLQEVFSQNRDVRELFDTNPMAEEC